MKPIEFVDDTLTTYKIEILDAALMKIRDGLSIATSGYEDVRQALPTMNPVEVPQILEQVPLPRIEGVHKEHEDTPGKNYQRKTLYVTVYFIWWTMELLS